MYKKIIKLLKSPAIADIWRWSKSSHVSIVFICLLNLIMTGNSLVTTLATKGLIDGATSHNSELVKRYACILIASVILVRICSFLNGVLVTRTNAHLLNNMRSFTLHKLLKKQYANLNSYHSGELVNRLFSDVNVVKDGIMGIPSQLVAMAVSFFGAAAILISMDWRFVILLVIGGFLGLFLILLFKEPMSKRHKLVQESEGKIHSIVQETLENLRIIKASGSEKRMEKQVELRQNEFFKVMLKRGYFTVGMNVGIGTTFQVSWLICMLWGCRGIYVGSLTYGSLAAIIQLIGQIQGPIAAAADVASQVFSTISSGERLKELLDLPEEDDFTYIDGQELYRGLKEIQVRDVDFSYGREDVLKKANIIINPGEFVAVTGVSGGGKSTLFQLLLGIYQPLDGSVQFCFKDKSERASALTRSLFAYVPQGNMLFSGTLRENFAMFTDAASDEEIREVAKIACIDHLIDELESGLDTIIGERGVGLSEGQAQRVAVARALLSKAPILLLDESTSALDEETEARLLDNISNMRNKTCFIVTHRRAALGICDYQIHIKDGALEKRDTDKTEEV